MMLVILKDVITSIQGKIMPPLWKQNKTGLLSFICRNLDLTVSGAALFLTEVFHSFFFMESSIPKNFHFNTNVSNTFSRSPKYFIKNIRYLR